MALLSFLDDLEIERKRGKGKSGRENTRIELPLRWPTEEKHYFSSFLSVFYHYSSVELTVISATVI